MASPLNVRTATSVMSSLVLVLPTLTVERLTVIEWKFIVQDFNCYVLEVVLAFTPQLKILKSFQLKQVVRSCYA